MNNKERRFKNGSYSFAMTVLAVLAAVIINLIAAGLPEKNTQIDFSSAKLYTLTDTTIGFLQGLTRDVDLYYICEGGKEDDTTERLLRRYEEASDHIRFRQVDPGLYPGFTGQFTEEPVEAGSIIASCGERYKVVDKASLYISAFSYASYTNVDIGYDGEGMITSAIDYVTNDHIPVLYVLNGNGEMDPADEFEDVIRKNNIDLAELNLLSAEEVPEDAAAILIAAPSKDYSVDEAKKIIKYLENGGKALIFSNYSAEDMPNFRTILNNYGVDKDPGIILEGDSTKYMTYQYSIIPVVDFSEVTAKLYENTFFIAPMAQPIRTLDTYRNSIHLTPILETTASAYAKVDVQNMTTSEKENGDPEGPFHIGMMIEEDIDNDSEFETEILYYSTGYLLDSDYNKSVSGANAKLLGEGAAHLCRSGEISSAVQTKNLQVEYLMIDDFSANIWTVICAFLIPAAFLATGGVIWFKRRRR